MIGRYSLAPLLLGNNLSRAIQIFGSSRHSKEKGANIEVLTRQIDKKKCILKKQEKNLSLILLRLLLYYRQCVYPDLIRGGAVGVPVTEMSYPRLIVEGLWRKYYDDCCKKNVNGNSAKYSKGVNDSKLEEDIADDYNKINLEDISVVFPFKESEARAELRILKI